MEGKTSFGRANTSNTSFVTSNMLLYLDAGNVASYPGSGTTWTNLAPGSIYNATSLTGIDYSGSNSGYISFNGAGAGSLDATIYNTVYTGKTVFVAAKLTAITGGTYRAFLGASAGSRNFNFYMYSPSSGVYQLHFSTGGGGALSTNLSYTIGAWFTAAFTQALDGTYIFYLNGLQVNQGSGATFSQYLAGSTEHVGRADNFWLGPLPIIAVYKASLTSAQILANHNAVRGRYGLS